MENLKLSDKAILFISKYAIKDLNIKSRINDDILDDIYVYAGNCEAHLVDTDGNDKEYYYDGKERDLLADSFVTELTSWVDGNSIDFEYLNNKLFK